MDVNDSARYDRQIRLWGEEGQTSIQKTSVMMFGSSSLATEVLKNLILPGIMSFHIVDDAIVTAEDLGKNFFIEKKHIGQSRAKFVVELLKELNPSVKGFYTICKPTAFPLNELLNFSIVVSSNLTNSQVSPIAQFLFDNDVPFLNARICGLFGYFRLAFKDHTIYNAHPEHPAPDLRLDQPFPSLLAMKEANNLSEMNHETHAHTPYVLLVLHALDIWRNQVGDTTAFPENYKQRKEIAQVLLDMRMPNDKGTLDEENFDEAIAALSRILAKTKIPSNVKQVFEHKLSDVANLTAKNANWFWILSASLKIFVEKHGVLPISGQLPDMTSDSKRYAELLGLYRAEAMKDAEEVFHTAQYIINQRVCQRVESSDYINFNQCVQFCKFASFIGVQQGTSLKQEDEAGIGPILKQVTEPEVAEHPRKVHPLTWLIMLKAVDEFHYGNQRFPGTNCVQSGTDCADLAHCIQRLVEGTKDSELINEAKTLLPEEAVREMVRYGDSEPHIIAAIMGGVVSQEAIKLATHQYVPVTNSFIYDAHTQSSASINL